MQKINKKGSILIWSVMLSLIISILFISISSKINKNIKLSGETSNYIYEKNLINSKIIENKDASINSDEILIFENNKKNTFSLKKDEKLILSFSGSSDFNIDLGVVKGGAIYYQYEKINLSNNKIKSKTGVLNYSESFSGKLDTTYNKGELSFYNLGGYSQFLINSEINFETSEKKYKIVKNIGNNSLIKTSGVK